MDREQAQKQLAEDKAWREYVMQVDLDAADVQPTPTQFENDMAAVIHYPLEKQYDGSPIDPSSPDPTEPNPPELPAPTLSSLDPNTAVAPVTGMTLTANGDNFGPDCKVVFDGAEKATTVVSRNVLTCAVDGAAAATVDVLVRGNKGDSSALPFTVTAAKKPEGVSDDRPNR
ncbi:hypothetical protein ACVMGC_001032 [Bradyrhizobium barranii subsp. barranii]|uniref:IPT/TIG domain-containing protein n=1 Tax=Bradyrhizobium japonicum TaxID=375 RepID=UPI0020A0DC8C|nr:IPT/TIG domain-containing protein [Bradyrhizobium japonicum]MCP1778815.1 hypothetical protein [Bradyrhizobium japonicum]MCP1958187.1 hypothetical protein [Bradyrhizobium japonicum]